MLYLSPWLWLLESRKPISQSWGNSIAEWRDLRLCR